MGREVLGRCVIKTTNRPWPKGGGQTVQIEPCSRCADERLMERYSEGRGKRKETTSSTTSVCIISGEKEERGGGKGGVWHTQGWASR